MDGATAWVRRPANVRWFPIVSGVQAVADMVHQLSPPPGFGHVYSTDYAKGWASIMPPEGWREADTERLNQFIHDISGTSRSRDGVAPQLLPGHLNVA
jgi:uncharacterized membrane protein